jgi:hypothetical protein
VKEDQEQSQWMLVAWKEVDAEGKGREQRRASFRLNMPDHHLPSSYIMASYTQHRQRRQDDQPSSRDASEEGTPSFPSCPNPEAQRPDLPSLLRPDVDNDDSSLKAANSKPHHAGGGNPGMRQKKSDVVGGRGGHPERGTDSPYEGDVGP